jgi:hypothetical protein
MPEDWRALTANEMAIVERLLGFGFPGSAEFLTQLPFTKARRWEHCSPEHCGSLDLQVSGGPVAPGEYSPTFPLPVEGWVQDDDGVPIEVLLFSRDGRLSELEFVVYSDKRKREPNAREMRVIACGSGPS